MKNSPKKWKERQNICAETKQEVEEKINERLQSVAPSQEDQTRSQNRMKNVSDYGKSPEIPTNIRSERTTN